MVWKNILDYPVLSINISKLLNSIECSGEIEDLFDRALWCYLSDRPFIEEFKITEFYYLKGWSEIHKLPKNFDKNLIDEFNKQLGIKLEVN